MPRRKGNSQFIPESQTAGELGFSLSFSQIPELWRVLLPFLWSQRELDPIPALQEAEPIKAFAGLLAPGLSAEWDWAPVHLLSSWISVVTHWGSWPWDWGGGVSFMCPHFAVWVQLPVQCSPWLLALPSRSFFLLQYLPWLHMKMILNFFWGLSSFFILSSLMAQGLFQVLHLQCDSEKPDQRFVHLLPLAPYISSFSHSCYWNMPLSLDLIVELLGFPWQNLTFSHPEQFGPTERIYWEP